MVERCEEGNSREKQRRNEGEIKKEAKTDKKETRSAGNNERRNEGQKEKRKEGNGRKRETERMNERRRKEETSIVGPTMCPRDEMTAWWKWNEFMIHNKLFLAFHLSVTDGPTD